MVVRLVVFLALGSLALLKPAAVAFSLQPLTSARPAALVRRRRRSISHQNNLTQLLSSESKNDADADSAAANDILSQLANGIGLEIRKDPLTDDDDDDNNNKAALVKSQAGDYDAEAVRARINSFIQDNAVAVLSFTTCPYCIRAKSILDEVVGCSKYEVIELDKLGGKDSSYAYRAELAEMTGRTSAPAIWIGAEFVGGCNDGPMGGIVSLQESGKLDEILRKVGAIQK